MEGSETEKVRTMLEGWARGDWSAGAEFIAPDLVMSAIQPEGQVERRGLEAAASFMTRFLADWERYWIEQHELEDLGQGQYLATITQRGIGKQSKLEITAPATIAITVRQGLIAQIEWYLAREDAVAALKRF